jgi:nanoRNase/pAp phosphatase (c-di-AMP/oligoRNAs hydrolase)
LDFSFPPEKFKLLLEQSQAIIWIDHHKTILDHPYNTPQIAGIRSTEKAACELTWQYFMSIADLPEAVALIGDRDAWKWQFTGTASFNEGIKIWEHDRPDAPIWTHLLKPASQMDALDQKILEEIINDGTKFLQYRKCICQDYMKKYGFETKLDGYHAFAQGLNMFGSEAFGDAIDHYDLCISFEYTGNQWTVSLYSKFIDVSQIAKKYGGGGHKGAAGFVCKHLPFQQIGEYRS